MNTGRWSFRNSVIYAAGLATLLLWGYYASVSEVSPSIRETRQELSEPTESLWTGGNVSTPSDQGNHVSPGPDDAKRIVLLTYMRSGSSFVGEFFNQYPGACYHFEPMRTIIASTAGEKLPGHEHRDEDDVLVPRNISDPEKVAYVRAIQNMLNCQHDQLPLQFLLPHSLLNRKNYHYLSNRDYLQCVEDRKNMTPGPLEYTSHIAPCIPLMQEVCRAAPIRAFKTILLWMELMEPLLALDPGVKIVHLIRDPRAVGHSRRQLGLARSDDQLVTLITNLCGLMLGEIQVRKKLEVRYPNSFYQLRYEDVAGDTTAALESLYGFIGLAVPDSVKAWVYNSTHAKSESEDRNPLGTSRRNASRSIKAWRSGLNIDIQKNVSDNPHCVELFEYAGYPPM